MLHFHWPCWVWSWPWHLTFWPHFVQNHRTTHNTYNSIQTIVTLYSTVTKSPQKRIFDHIWCNHDLDLWPLDHKIKPVHLCSQVQQSCKFGQTPSSSLQDSVFHKLQPWTHAHTDAWTTLKHNASSIVLMVDKVQKQQFNPLKPNFSNYYTLPYRPNLPFLISDTRALWRSALSARVLECQKLKKVG